MTTALLSGIGKITLWDYSATDNAGLFAEMFAAFEINGTATTAKAQRWVAGTLTTSDEKIKSKDYTIKLTGETWDIRTFELSMGEAAQLSTTVDQSYDYFETTVPTTSPYEVSVAGLITSTTEADTYVTILSPGSWIPATPIVANLEKVASSPTSGQFAVSTTSGSEKITFNAAQAGAPVGIMYRKPLTSKLTIGLEDTFHAIEQFKLQISFFADGFPNSEARIFCPLIKKTSLAKFSVAGSGTPTTENEFTITQAAGYRSPFIFTVV